MNRRDVVRFLYVLMRDHKITKDQIKEALKMARFVNLDPGNFLKGDEVAYKVGAEFMADMIWLNEIGEDTTEREQANVRQVQGALPSVHIRKDD